MRNLARVAPDQQIASILNRLGYRTGHGHSWTRSRVNSLRASHGVPCFDPAQRERWVTLTEAAQLLGISPMSFHRLLERGLLKGQQVVPHAPWLIRREDLTDPGVVQAVEAVRRRRGLPLLEAGGQQNLDFSAE